MKLPSMYFRQQRGDMIEVFKIITGKDRVDQEKLLPINKTGRTRGHDRKLVKKRGRLNIRKYSFGLRVVNNWNTLPDWVVNAKDVNDFKGKLDKHWVYKQYSVRPTHAPSILTRRSGPERVLQA